MNNQQINKYKKILLNTMKDFISLCKENDLQYIAAYGTVLGAVRHKGLIPWDDDIDVYMPREDYDKFIKLKKEISSSNYEIIDYNDKGYYLPYAKFCNKNTTLWECKEFPFIIGVFIDIFPLDNISSDTTKANENFKKFSSIWKQYSNGLLKYTTEDIFKWLINFNIVKPFKYIYNLAFKYLIKYNKNRLINIEKQIYQNKGEFYIYYDLMTPKIDINRIRYPKEWFDETIEVTFEDFKIKIPAKYHEYLTNEYGDYMQLPPEEQRKSQHFHYYINLEQRLKLKEIEVYN